MEIEPVRGIAYLMPLTYTKNKTSKFTPQKLINHIIIFALKNNQLNPFLIKIYLSTVRE